MSGSPSNFPIVRRVPGTSKAEAPRRQAHRNGVTALTSAKLQTLEKSTPIGGSLLAAIPSQQFTIAALGVTLALEMRDAI